MSILRKHMPGQLSLLGEVERGHRRRVALDATSWVEHVPRWFTDGEALMHALLREADWEQRSRWMYDKTVSEPRLTAEYRVLADAPVPRLREVGALLSKQYGVPYDRAWLNHYRDQNDSTSWHNDRPCLPEHCTVPVLSLGATRRFLIRSRAGGASVAFIVESGDLIVMGGRCQRDWLHSVPKETSACSSRVSVNFSSIVYGVP